MLKLQSALRESDVDLVSTTFGEQSTLKRVVLPGGLPYQVVSTTPRELSILKAEAFVAGEHQPVVPTDLQESLTLQDTRVWAQTRSGPLPRSPYVLEQGVPVEAPQSSQLCRGDEVSTATRGPSTLRRGEGSAHRMLIFRNHINSAHCKREHSHKSLPNIRISVNPL